MCSMAVAEGLPAAGAGPGQLPAAPTGPARPAARRAPAGHHVPCLFVHGTRDPFGTPDELTGGDRHDPRPGHPRLDRRRRPRPEGRRRQGGRVGLRPPSCAGLPLTRPSPTRRSPVLGVELRRGRGGRSPGSRRPPAPPPRGARRPAAASPGRSRCPGRAGGRPASSPTPEPTSEHAAMRPLASAPPTGGEQLGGVDTEGGHVGPADDGRAGVDQPHRPAGRRRTWPR